jgi:hypothetical protein
VATVSVRVWPTLTALFGAESIRSRTLGVEVADGAMLLDLLRCLAATHPAFGAVMFGADGAPTDPTRSLEPRRR